MFAIFKASKNPLSSLKNNKVIHKVIHKTPKNKRNMATSSGLKQVVIVSYARTPIGSFNGALSSFSATQLGSFAIKGALEKIKLDPKEVQEVYMGNVVSSNLGQAPTRQAATYAGLPTSTICTGINKVCSSGMKAVMLAASSIMLGQQDVIVAGGMESMTNIPYYLEKGRNGFKYGHGQVLDGVLKDGLTNVYDGWHMGNCAEDCAKKYNVSRKDQDDYAVSSYKRAAAAYQAGHFKSEIVPLTVASKKGDTIVSEDEGYKKVDFDKMSTLKPAFDKNGTVTAANASSLNDGASALILMSSEKASALGLKPLARIISFADAENPPVEFTTAPSKAIPKALAAAKLDIKDVDYFEINEAFSVVSVANNKILGLDPNKVNIWGGAVALGHPIGSSGSRIVGTLAHILQAKNAKIGAAGICNGGGGASAIVIERI